MCLDCRDQIEGIISKIQLRHSPLSDADAADIDPPNIGPMRGGYTLFRVIDAMNFPVARHRGQLGYRSAAATANIENCVGLLNRDMTQSPIGQFRMMPI